MIPFPNVKAQIIYADPAWSFKTYSQKGQKRSAIRYYNTLSINDICKLPISDISDDNCTLFLWAIDSMLPEAFRVIKEWGFIYKTVAFTWIKENIKSDGYFTGMGYWTRCNPEQCLLATKGKPKRISKSVKQLVFSKRQEHSKKPDIIRNNIVELCGDLPRVELFARQKVKGWHSWGDQI